ncbi:hypothetical protein Patl1_21338 [Pistacia atlantica]|uniref:Uncharacterized protein n=1 Tax=Pistacia atlantica TaxID=434234 RepID=A0ACC1BIQ5_9ROSI|nr:hypothetical protein Patl1_21338 [Pistacia atlantica]
MMQTKLVTRCSPGRLFNVLQRLTPEQKEAVKSMGFGSLLGLRCRTLRRSLCLWLLERFNTTRRSLDICGECIPLSPRDVELVMGLAASGKDVVNSGPDDLIADLRHSYNATNHGISVRLLEERLAVPEAGEDFKRSFVLYALGTLLSPTARLDVSPSFLHFLTNMDVIHQYNWGKFLLDRLVREVSRYRQGKQRAVGGCLLFLQLFYYESISIEGSGSMASAVVPCLSSWGEEEITEREKRERELGGYGSGEVICKERSIGMESSEYRDQLDVPLVSKNDPIFEEDRNQAEEERMNGDIAIDEVDMPNFLESQSVVCGDIEVVVESIRSLCRNKEYGCNETVDYTKSCHCILAANIGILEGDLEEDGELFLLNKGVENIGNTVMITRLGPSSSKEKYLYDLVSGRGISSLRLKSLTENFPGRLEGFPLTAGEVAARGLSQFVGEYCKNWKSSEEEEGMNSSLMLRRFFCFNVSSSSSSATTTACASKKKPLVFLGSPQVSATVLDALFNASSSPTSHFEVAAIVTQPSRRDRGRKVLPSPVAQFALERGFSSDLIFTPERAGEDAFLTSLRALQPELCITAAYGNILPSKFLNIPPLGTVNIHPSLLPLYRGAAPVQRALQDGAKETGVSLAFTVRALDAGPVIACERMEVDDQIKAPDLLALLFSEGSKLLIRELPYVLDGSAKMKAQAQDDSKATLAPKGNIVLNCAEPWDSKTGHFSMPQLVMRTPHITPEESWLSFDQEASILHNKVRAFAGWPGTRAKVAVVDDRNSEQNIIELKIITTRVCAHSKIKANEVDGITFRKGALVIPCGGCTALEVLEVQLPGKKVVNAAAFWNGLRGRKLKII